MTLVHALRPYVRHAGGSQSGVRAEAERCEICSARLEERHPHVLRREPRAVLCSCGPCATLFRDSHASGGRLRTIDDRVLSDPRADLDDAAWAALGVPVGVAFFVVDSGSGECTGFCPSPAGAVQMEIAPAAWQELSRRTPIVRGMARDIEGLIVHRPRGERAEAFVAPIDACYALAGAVRTHWKGFDGGDDARRAIEEVLRDLRLRARPVTHSAAEAS